MKKLNFGCGFDIKEGWDNIDKKDFDFNKFPYPIKDNTYEEIYINKVLEYLHDIPIVLKELRRISKPNAKIIILAPHYTNKGAYNSLEHSHYLSEVAFWDYLRRENAGFELERLELIPTGAKGELVFCSWFRKKLSLFINGLIESIYVELRVIK